MIVEIVAPTGVVWKGEASQVRLPAAGGDMGILPGHTPVMAGLESGVIVIDRADGEVMNFSVPEGLVTVDSDHIYVVVESAERAD